MKNPVKCLSFLMILFASSIAGQDRAVIRNGVVEISIDAIADPGRPVIAALYGIDDGKRKQKSRFEQKVTSSGGVTRFTLPLPAVPSPAYVVSVFEFPLATETLSYELTVGKELTSVLSASTSACPNALEIMFSSVDYTLDDWRQVAAWLGMAEGMTTVTVKNSSAGSDYPVKDIRVITRPDRAVEVGQMIICIELRPNLPLEAYSASVSFSGPPRADLASEIKGSGFKSAPIPKTPTSVEDNGVPGQRGMERNLDLGLSFTSSVGEKTADDGSKFVARTNRGTFDIRLAPLLKTQGNKPFDREQRWYRYFTPAYLDAAVSTGKIEKDTLSLNRVIFGTEYEWRYYNFKKRNGTGDTQTNPYVTFHRIILSAEHASDRDFKQKEFLGSIEYSPVVGALNHPLYLNWKYNEKGEKVAGTFGYEIVPRFGFTLGRTYSRRNPAAAIQPSKNVKRAHIGLDMTFNLSQYLQIGIKDTIYLRGEAKDDRFHNYFKGTVEAPLGRPFANSVNSLFLTFERGQQPPFASPRDVNVVKVGYRIRSEGWWDRFR